MRTMIQVIMIMVLLFAAFGKNAYADEDPNWCGKMIAKKWKRVAGNYHHFGDKVIISKSGSGGTYEVEIKDHQGGDKLSGTAFVLTCTASPLEASLSGEIKVDNCVHPFTFTVPYTDDILNVKHYDQISYGSGNHTTPKCPDHPESSHLELMHPGSAHGHDDP